MNMNNLMAQAQKMQKDIQKKQEELNSMVFDSSNEFVKLELSGDKSLKSIKILKDNLDSDDIECLEDMISIAYKDAMDKLNKEFDKKMGMYSKLSGGLF